MTAVIRPTDEATGATEIPAVTLPRVSSGTEIVGAPAGTAPALLAWVLEVAELTRPDRVVFSRRVRRGVDAAHRHMLGGRHLRQAGRPRPNSFYAASDPTDVARVEDRTFICSVDEADAGPTNNWMDPAEMKADHDRACTAGCMRGRTMYVVPFCMGPVRRRQARCSAWRSPTPSTSSRRCAIMTRMGTRALDADQRRRDRGSRPCTRSARRWSRAQEDVPWPCNDTKYITQFPEERTIWSFGSGYGGNALLGKKCYSLRIASVMARDEGWLAEHMLILKLTSPDGKVRLHRRRVPAAPAARPTSRCWSRPSRAGRSRRSATTSPGCGSARTAGSTRSTPSTACSASRRAPAGTPTRMRCAPSPRATRCSPTWP